MTAGRADTLIVDAQIATMAGSSGGYGVINRGAIAMAGGRISWVGPAADCPIEARTRWSAGGAWITPGLVDCHTHLIFGGSRVNEFERRLAGASYEELARAGGGILATVTATRDANEDELVSSGLRRLRWLTRSGVTTVEIKSGYGLDTDTELRMLRAARALEGRAPVRVATTLLAAHTLPPETDPSDDPARAAYVDQVCQDTIPAAAAGLADAVDAFCEGIGFTPSEVERVFVAAAEAGLPVKLHADQLSDLGGAGLAASFGALSADHLEHTSTAGVAALAEAGTIAVLLPGATYALGEEKRPPLAELRRAGVPMALATDLNPGSAPVGSLPLVASMGATLLGLQPDEALAGITRNAARALGLGEEIGTIEVGKRADLAVWDIDQPAELSYWVGADLCRAVWFDGALVHDQPVAGDDRGR